MKFNKDLIKTIAIIVLIVLLLVIFLVPPYNQSIYEKGLSDGRLEIVQTQMSTGNVFLVVDGAIQGYPISAFCSGNT